MTQRFDSTMAVNDSFYSEFPHFLLCQLMCLQQYLQKLFLLLTVFASVVRLIPLLQIWLFISCLICLLHIPSFPVNPSFVKFSPKYLNELADLIVSRSNTNWQSFASATRY